MPTIAAKRFWNGFCVARDQSGAAFFEYVQSGKSSFPEKIEGEKKKVVYP